MIISGANTNTFFSSIGLQRSASVTAASKSLFSKRLDILELSDLFNKFSDVGTNKSRTAEIQKMLARSENDNAKNMADGITGYAYMEISLVREAMRAETNIARFNYYSEEKAYYQSLLDEADGNTAADTSRQIPAYDDYEYICKENEPVDREKALQALANVQNRIDSLINDTQETERLKTDIQTYNKCANSFSEEFDADSSEFVLTDDDYSKLFGKIEADEENYVQKYSERANNLWKCYDKLKERMNSSIEKMLSRKGGEERTKAIKNALSQAYGNSLADIMDLIEELQMTKERE